jgi:site-specific recombinase XerD
MSAALLPGALAALTDRERAEREGLLESGGDLAATMRLAEARPWPSAAMLADAWRWACWLLMARGFRGQTTVAKYCRGLIEFAAWLSTQVDARPAYCSLGLVDLDAWLRHLYAGRRLSPSSRSVAVSAVKSFYRWRASRGYGRDCTFGLVAPKVPRRVPRRYTTAELRAMFATIDTARTKLMQIRDRAVLLLLLSTGMRREEVSTLRVADVQFERRIAVIRVRGKGAKEREVAIEGPVVKSLAMWIDARAQDPRIRTDAIFCGVTRPVFGAPLGRDGVEGVVQRYARRARLTRWGVHMFRVTFATQLYDDGVDIERIRILLGHESIETTRGYLAVSNRQRSVRLKSHRQHAVLGTAPDGLPMWAKQLEGEGHAG